VLTDTIMKVIAYAVALGALLLASPAVAHVDEKSDDFAAPEVSGVFDAMHGDIYKCLSHSRGNAYITVEAVVKNDGTVASVKTTGGALAGPAAMKCVERRVLRARFPHLRGKGTSRVKAAFELDN